MRVVAKKKLPFDPLLPNEATITAMKEDPSKLPTFDNVDALMDELQAGD